jgi:hypothetical protein
VSAAVKKYIFDNGVDPDVIHLNDSKFLQNILHMLCTLFNYKTNLTLEQFFKYGYAESKMLLCADVIELVKKET